MLKNFQRWSNVLAGLALAILIVGCNKEDNTPSNIVKDIDGNIYTTISIGIQIWMCENLKTTRLNDGTAIPLVTDNAEWQALSSPGYCFYKNYETGFKPSHGALYNGYAVKTGKLCPKGWHVPSNEEWLVLLDFYGGDYNAGSKLKASIPFGWNKNITGNEINKFAALPGGARKMRGFEEQSTDGFWWSATESEIFQDYSYYYTMDNMSSFVMRDTYLKKYGLSVRCIKDE